MADQYNPTIGSFKNPTPLLGERARNDWGSYWNNSKAGETQNWAGGTLTRNEDNTATFAKNGQSQTFNQSTSMEELAAGNEDIANMWGGQYGVLKPVSTQLNFDPSTGYQSAATRTVTANELTSNQVGKVLDANSPLIQQAVRRSMEQSNGRGLLNSSIAAGAGTEAAIAQALPIASADAGAYQQAAQDSQNALNQFGLAKNAGIINSQLAGINADFNLRNQRYQNDFTGSENDKDRTQKQVQYDQDYALNQSQFDQKQAQNKSQFDQTYAQTQTQFDQKLAQDREQWMGDDAYRRSQLTQQNNQFLADNALNIKKANLDADKFRFAMDQAVATLNSANSQAYSNAVQTLLLSNIENKEEAFAIINKTYFGNADGNGKFPFNLDVRAPSTDTTMSTQVVPPPGA